MISAIIPARNCLAWIEESVRSLAEQSLPPDEILVADDASDDGTADLLDRLEIPSLRVLRSDTRMGISTQLNRLLSEAKGRYILRMDGDDISAPGRIQTQMAFLESSPAGILGSWAQRFGQANTIHAFSADDHYLKAGLLFSVPFCHPTILIDRNRLGNGVFRYDPDFDAAEDYELWVRLRSEVVYGNVPKILLKWRMHNTNAGTDPTTSKKQRELATTIRSRLIGEYGLELNELQRHALEARSRSQPLSADESSAFLSTLVGVNNVPEAILGAPRHVLKNVLFDQWTLANHFSAWKTPGTPRAWREGCRALGLKAPAKTFLSLALKSCLGRFRA